MSPSRSTCRGFGVPVDTVSRAAPGRKEFLTVPRSPWLLGNHRLTFTDWPGPVRTCKVCRNVRRVILHSQVECPKWYFKVRSCCPGFLASGERDPSMWLTGSNNMTSGFSPGPYGRIWWPDLLTEDRPVPLFGVGIPQRTNISPARP